MRVELRGKGSERLGEGKGEAAVETNGKGRERKEREGRKRETKQGLTKEQEG